MAIYGIPDHLPKVLDNEPDNSSTQLYSSVQRGLIGHVVTCLLNTYVIMFWYPQIEPQSSSNLSTDLQQVNMYTPHTCTHAHMHIRSLIKVIQTPQILVEFSLYVTIVCYRRKGQTRSLVCSPMTARQTS